MPSGPLIVDPTIEYVTLSRPADVNRDKAHARKQLHAMQLGFFGEGGRTLEHFHLMLELNLLTDLKHPIRDQWGLTRYFITYAKRQGAEEIIAGSTYLAIPCAEGAMISIPYTFVAEHERESGVGENFRTERSNQTCAFLKEFGLLPSSAPAQLTSWCEFEDPLRLTLDDHHASIHQAGIAPLRRAKHWYKVGYRSFDLDHVELRAKDGAPACSHYSLNVLTGSPEPLLVSQRIARLVTVNAAICRLHGDDPNNDPMHRAEIEQIMALSAHRPRDRRSELQELEPRLAALLAEPDDPATKHMTVGELLALRK